MKKPLVFILVAVCLLGCALLIWKGLRRDSASKESGDTRSGPITESKTLPVVNDESPDADSEGLPEDPASLIDRTMLRELDQLAERFRSASSVSEQYALYREMLQIVHGRDELAAAATIASFLRSGVDAPTGLPFQVGSDGVLETAPTLRAALLDRIAQLDPDIALDVSREIMDSRTTQDEYAIGLRNLSWYDLEGDMHGEMESRFSDMLDEQEWLSSPSAGFLEAFDIAVELASPESFDDIVSVTRLEDSSGNPVENGVERASFVALDRIMLRNPEMVIEKYLSDPGLLDYAPNHRASLMSRLDLSTSTGTDAFVAYVNATNHKEGEMEYFSSLFPNGNYFYGNRLVSSQEETLSISQMQQRDRSTLEAIEKLNRSGQIPKQIGNRIANRLTEYLNQISEQVPEDPSLRLD